MKLLLIFSKNNGPNSFSKLFDRYLNQFKDNCEVITIIDFDSNRHLVNDGVRVLSLRDNFLLLNKENTIIKFFKYLWQERKKYDVILFDLEGWVVMLAGMCWRLADKKIWWFNNNYNRRLNLTCLSWLADRTFYSDHLAFISLYGSAEFLSAPNEFEKIFKVDAEVSHSKLKIISPTFGRYIFSGLIVVGVNILSLAFLTRVWDWWYLSASIVSFFVAFIVSFFLQKTLTYRDSIWRTWNWQLLGYFLVSLLNLACNTLILYILVDWVGLNDLLAQALTVGIISLVLFFVYGRLIFRPKVN